MCHKVLFSRLN